MGRGPYRKMVYLVGGGRGGGEGKSGGGKGRKVKGERQEMDAEDDKQRFNSASEQRSKFFVQMSKVSYPETFQMFIV